MTTYDKRESRGWKTVKHGVYSDHPSLPLMSLAVDRPLITAPRREPKGDHHD